MLGSLANGKITLKEFLVTFRQKPTREAAWRALFYISIVTSVAGVFFGTATFVLQNVFITVLVWWVNQVEQALSEANARLSERK